MGLDIMMQTVIDRLVRYLVSCAKAVELDAPDILAAVERPRNQGSYEHENFKYGAHVFLVLYTFDHPANPYFDKSETFDIFARQVEHWLTKWEQTGCGFAEWPPLCVCRALDLLGDRLDDELRGRIERFVDWFVREDIPKPFFFTAPNHEAWRLAVTALAGRLLGRPEWIELAAFQMKQLIAYQNPEGFWDEGRHHGPSMKYNSLQLGAMAVVAQETGDEDIRAATKRLADFMANWSFPDGVTVGAFDGRQSTSPGYFGRLVPGLELADAGVTHIKRIMQFWEGAGWLDDPRQAGPSNWYAYFGMPFPAESLVYHAQSAPAEPAVAAGGDRGHPPDSPPSTRAATEDALSAVAGLREAGAVVTDHGYNGDALPMEADGAVLENHSPYFDGVLRRQGPWCVALSGQLSDVPKDTLFIYRLERQNRIEVWHENASVVLGGGHNVVTAEHPLYNVWVETGFEADKDGRWAGKVEGDVVCRVAQRPPTDQRLPAANTRRSPRPRGAASTGSTEMAARRSKYYPRAASTGTDGEVSWLKLVFAHATVRFEIEPQGDELTIRYMYETMGVRELRLTLPLVLWRSGATCHVDGRPLDGPVDQQEPSETSVEREVSAECPLFGTTTLLTVPSEGRSLARFPLWPLRSYGPLFEDERFESFFTMAQVETVIENPGRTGSGEWTLRTAAS
jgi:hypothetical protein